MLNHLTTIGLKHNHAKENRPKNRRSHVLRQSLFSKIPCRLQTASSRRPQKTRIETMAHSRWGCMRRPWQHGRVIGHYSVLFFAGRSSLEGLMMVTHEKNIWSVVFKRWNNSSTRFFGILPSLWDQKITRLPGGGLVKILMVLLMVQKSA